MWKENPLRSPPTGAASGPLFLMKLHAARPERDHDDLVNLWSLTTFTDPADAAAHHDLAYPAALPDEHLATYIAEIANEAAARTAVTDTPPTPDHP